MKTSRARSLYLVAVVALLASLVAAQEGPRTVSAASKYLISAKAGGINHAEGPVTVARLDGSGGMLIKGDRLSIGDKVTTGAGGRVEVLLNPGSYLRLGSNSTAEFKTTSLDDLQIKLDSGSAMFEVFATNDFTVSLFLPKGKVRIVESGVYRIDLAADGSGILAVTEGKAMVGTTVVKEGRTGTIDGKAVVVAKFDRGKRDDLAEWSKTRAKDLAKMTASLQNREVRNSLMSSFFAGHWGIWDSFGLWVFNPRFGMHCFLPFGYGWNSPYGYGYGPGIYWYNLPPAVYNPPTTGTPVITGGPVRTGPSKVVTGGDPGSGGIVTRTAPPYSKVETDREPIRVVRNDGFPMDTTPVRPAPSSAPTVVTMPPPPPPSEPVRAVVKKDGN